MPFAVLIEHGNTSAIKLYCAYFVLFLSALAAPACSDANRAPQPQTTTQLAATGAPDAGTVWDLYDDFSGDLGAWRLDNPTKATVQNGRVLLNGDQGAVALISRVPVNGRAIRITGISEESGRCWEIGLDDNTTSRQVRLVRDDPTSTDLFFGRKLVGPLPANALLDLEIVPGNDAYAYKITNGATVVGSGSLPLGVPAGVQRISLLSYCGTRVFRSTPCGSLVHRCSSPPKRHGQRSTFAGARFCFEISAKPPTQVRCGPPLLPTNLPTMGSTCAGI